MLHSDVDYRLSGVQAWPTMFFRRFWQDFARENEAIVQLLQSLKKSQQTSVESGIAIGAKPSTGLYEGSFDLFRNSDDSLQKLVRFVSDSLALAVSIANGQEHLTESIQVDFVDSWYHITNDGGFHDAHHHHGCSWCGIYYVKTGRSSSRTTESAPNGGSRFYSPLSVGGAYRDYGNKYLAESLDPPISDGLLLLFPSYLLHSGLPYRGTEDRIVIAFNARVFLKASSEAKHKSS